MNEFTEKEIAVKEQLVKDIEKALAENNIEEKISIMKNIYTNMGISNIINKGLSSQIDHFKNEIEILKSLILKRI